MSLTESDNNTKQAQWNELYYGYLIGSTVVKVESTVDEEGSAWTKIFFKKDGVTLDIEISSDQEGNAPGFLFGLPAPSDEDNPFIA